MSKTTVSSERVWMKHYPPESLNAKCPRMKVYSFLKECNKDRPNHPILYYYGAKITVRDLLERIDRCADAFAALGGREKQILSLRFYDGKTQMEVAKEISISQAQVSRLEKNALNYMRKIL